MLASAGCIKEPPLVQCGDLLCPSGTTCVASQCAPQEAVDACTGQIEGASCTDSTLGDGVCHAGVCIARGCGNGVVEPGEVCDDGNRTSLDGCAADCGGVDLCPPLGTTPTYQPQTHEAFAHKCTDYAASAQAGFAIAMCDEASGTLVDGGPPDGPLAPVAGFTPTGTDYWYKTRLAPEGDALILNKFTSPVFDWVIYSRAQDGTWGNMRMLGFSSTTELGIPSAGPARRIFGVLNTGLVIEYELDGTSPPATIATYMPSDLGGVSVVGPPNLSPDGLRLITVGPDGHGGYAQLYSDRPDLNSRFPIPKVAASLPTVGTVFQTANCERLYFPSLGAIYYVNQGPWQ